MREADPVTAARLRRQTDLDMDQTCMPRRLWRMTVMRPGSQFGSSQDNWDEARREVRAAILEPHTTDV